MKPKKPWAIGDQIADMHGNGLAKLGEQYDVDHHIQFRLQQENMPKGASYRESPSNVFCQWLQTYNSCMSNKMLVLIDYPNYDGYWTAAYQYDGVYAGIVRLRPKTDL